MRVVTPQQRRFVQAVERLDGMRRSASGRAHRAVVPRRSEDWTVANWRDFAVEPGIARSPEPTRQRHRETAMAAARPVHAPQIGRTPVVHLYRHDRPAMRPASSSWATHDCARLASRIARVARPLPLLRTRHQTRSHRVEMNVAADGPVIAFILDHLGAIPTLEKVARSPPTPSRPDRIS